MSDFEARFADFGIPRFTSIDPLAEKYYSVSPYAYCLNNPVRYFDPDGRSTHTDSLGNVVAVYNDGNMGVFKHNISSETYDGTRLSFEDGTNMGETEFWDEFINPETNEVWHQQQILFGESFDPLIKELSGKAEKMNLITISNESRSRGEFDIKNKEKYKNKGALLNGKYATSRSAGNYLAGYNAKGIPFDTFQRLAGAIHVKENKGEHLSKLEMTRITIFDVRYGPHPAYGESMYQYRMSFKGWHHGRFGKKR